MLFINSGVIPQLIGEMVAFWIIRTVSYIAETNLGISEVFLYTNLFLFFQKLLLRYMFLFEVGLKCFV